MFHGCQKNTINLWRNTFTKVFLLLRHIAIAYAALIEQP